MTRLVSLLEAHFKVPYHEKTQYNVTSLNDPLLKQAERSFERKRASRHLTNMLNRRSGHLFRNAIAGFIAGGLAGHFTAKRATKSSHDGGPVHIETPPPPRTLAGDKERIAKAGMRGRKASSVLDWLSRK
jgi:hypothetical protein